MRKTNLPERSIHLMLLVAALGGLGGLPIHAQTARDNALILPGKSIGQIKLDAELPTVEKEPGAPTEGEGASGRAWDTWVSPRDDAGQSYRTSVYAEHTASNDGVQSVLSIRITSPFFHTSAGIDTQSSLEAVWKAFPGLQYDTTYQHDGQTSEVYADDLLGISFEVRRTPVDAGGSTPSGTPWGTYQAVGIYKAGSGTLLVPSHWHAAHFSRALRPG